MKTTKMILVLVVLMGFNAMGSVYINELYMDPPGGDDTGGRAEYVEVRGQANGSLAGYYLVFVEGEKRYISRLRFGDLAADNGGILIAHHFCEF